MSSQPIIVVAGDRPVADRVIEKLSARGIDHHIVDPAVDSVDAESMFDASFQLDAAGVLLIEPLGRGGRVAEPPGPELVRAAMAAAKAPGAAFLGWVTPRAADDDELERLRRSGVPYGILRTGPIFDVEIPSASRGSRPGQTLVSQDLADELAQAQASVLDELAAETATWIEREWVCEGRTAAVSVSERPLEARLAALGIEPLVLPRWRVGINGFFGMTVLEPGDQEGTLVLRRRPLRIAKRSRARLRRDGRADSEDNLATPVMTVA